MKKHLLILSGIVFLMACSNTHQKTKYNLKQTDWKIDKLIGKVKTLVQYKANVINLKSGKTEKPRIELKKEYTKFGMISFQEDYDSFNELVQKTIVEYNKNGLSIKSITNTYQPSSKTVQTNQYDTAERPISVIIIYNDTVHYSTHLKYNSHGDLIEQISDQNGEKTLNEFKYKYNKKGKVAWKDQIQNDKSGKTEYLMTFKYNSTGNLTETTNKSDVFGEMKWLNKYNSKDKLEETVEYENGQIQRQTYFDGNHNQTSVKYFVNGKLNREMKFEYSFDKTGNWTVKKAFLKQSFARDKKFIPIYVETRKINYYE